MAVTHDRRDPAPETRTLAISVALLVVLTLAVFLPSLGYEFVNYDDRAHILEHPLLQQPLSAASLTAAFRPYHDNWIPLTWLSLRADYALFGPRAGAFLATNVLLHALAAVALFLALARASVRAPAHKGARMRARAHTHAGE